MLFYLKLKLQLELDSQKACTDTACNWNNYFMQKVEPSTVAEIQFFSEQSREIRRKTYLNAVPQATSAGPSHEERMDLLTNLSKLKRMPTFLHSFAPFAESFVPKCKPTETVKAPA